MCWCRTPPPPPAGNARRPRPARRRSRLTRRPARALTGRRTIRSTDVTPAGVFRLDALARYLQDVAEDDVATTGWQAPYGWLLRRCTVTALGLPATRGAAGAAHVLLGEPARAGRSAPPRWRAPAVT